MKRRLVTRRQLSLIYDDQRRLREFVGISDIRDEEDERHVARVVFHYLPAAPAETGS